MKDHKKDNLKNLIEIEIIKMTFKIKIYNFKEDSINLIPQDILVLEWIRMRGNNIMNLMIKEDILNEI